MKIAIIIGGTGCGPNIARRMAQELADKGHFVDVFLRRSVAKDILMHHARVRYLVPPVWLEWLCGEKGIEPGDILFRMWHLLFHHYDVIHVAPGHRPSILVPCLLAKYFRKSIIVEDWWEWYGRDGVCSYRKGFFKKLMSLYDSATELPAKRLYDAVLPITTTLAKRIPNHPLCVVLHGAMDESLKERTSVVAARTALGLDPNYFIIGMSNVEAWDHADNQVFFEAVKEACLTQPNLHLLLTGEENFIHNAAARIVPKDRIISLGWVPFEKYQLYLSACDMFALPYPDNPRNRGRWPNKFGDYMALQRPVLTNATGDVGAMIEKWDLGFLCEHEKAAYLDVMLRLCTRHSLVSSDHFGFDRIPEQELMNFSQRMDRVLEIYRQALEKKHYCVGNSEG